VDYKIIIASLVLYTSKRLELAKTDFNITQDEEFIGEIKALEDILDHIDVLLAKNNQSEGLNNE
jgi:hypothetical protein